ncbi:hypothetical protein CSA37_12280 [Candidatus Fermentibacteria bacterium]|nr:MAG: hypothetical protein CSA37_12280 [Candidatus Fermentibacteria bacterium]
MNKSKVAYLISQAREYAETGQRDEALEMIREALREDPGEITITEVILSMERNENYRTSSGVAVTSIERNRKGTMDPKLLKAFKLSDEAYSNGNEAKALAYLRKAASLFPESTEAESKLAEMKTRIQATNLVAIGIKKLDEGDFAKAAAASKKAFELMPDAPGLDNLRARIEKGSCEPESIQKTAAEPAGENPNDSGNAHSAEAMLWVDRIRAAVKEDRFEDAGKMVAEAVENHPGNPLLNSFYTKLKRLGFIS